MGQVQDWIISICGGLVAGGITGLLYHFLSGRQLRTEAKKLHEATTDVNNLNVLILRTFEKLGVIEYSKKDGKYVGLVHEMHVGDTLHLSQGLSDAIDKLKEEET